MTKRHIGIEVAGPEGETYKITDFIAEGAFGVVYRATGIRSGNVVAIKLLAGSGLLEEEDSFAREMEILPRITHPNVVRVLHVESDGGSVGPYLAMEYMRDGTLRKLLDERRGAASPFEPSLARDMMLQLAQGAKVVSMYALHRDIRPENILRDDQLLKLADFGIARPIDAATGVRTFKGVQAPEYRAPENFEGGMNTPKLDVYAMGLVFYELCALIHPLENAVDPRDPGAWRRAHLHTIPRTLLERRPDLPERVAGLIDRMIAKAPGDRPDWPSIVRVLADEDIDPPDDLVGVLSAARRRARSVEKSVRLAHQAFETDRERLAAAEASYVDLVRRFDDVVRELNDHSAHPLAVIAEGPQHSRMYEFTHGASVGCIFLNPEYHGAEIDGRQVLAAGYLCVATEGGPSGNLLLLGERSERSPVTTAEWVGAVLPDEASYPRPHRQKAPERPSAGRAMHDVGPDSLGSSEDPGLEWRGNGDGRSLHGYLASLPPQHGVQLFHDVRGFFLSFVKAALELPAYGGVIVPPQEFDVGTRHIVLPPRLK